MRIAFAKDRSDKYQFRDMCLISHLTYEYNFLIKCNFKDYKLNK